MTKTTTLDKPMNPQTLSQAAVLAQNIDTESAVLDKSQFRYKAWDCINKSNLQIFKNENLIEQDDVWNAWNWTDDAETAVRAVRRSAITEASDEQLERFREYAASIMELPLDGTFLVSESSLVGRQVGNLHEAGIIHEVDASGKVSVWALTPFARRVINSVVAQAQHFSNQTQAAIPADD